MVEILIPISVFACLFGIFYLFYTTRNRERLALIEKGVDASLFQMDGKNPGKSRLMNILSVSLTLIGVGLGIVMGIVLHNATGQDAVYPACIFLFAGLGLFTSFLMSKRLLNKN